MNAKEAIELLKKYPSNRNLIVAVWDRDMWKGNDQVFLNWTEFVDLVEGHFDWSGTKDDMSYLADEPNPLPCF